MFRFTGGPNWAFRCFYRQTDRQWSFSVTHIFRHSRGRGRIKHYRQTDRQRSFFRDTHFSSFTGGPNWAFRCLNYRCSSLLSVDNKCLTAISVHSFLSTVHCWISFWYSSWILPRNPPHPFLPYCGWRSAGIVWVGQQGHEPNPPLESSIRSPSWSLRLLLLTFGAFVLHFRFFR